MSPGSTPSPAERSTAAGIRVAVLVFGRLADVLGRDTIPVRVPRPATVRDVAAAVLATVAEPHAIPPLAYAVNRAHVPADHAVEDGDEVALLPPLAGG